MAKLNDGWQDIRTAPVGKRFLAYVPINNHRLVIAMKTDIGLILNESLNPMPFPPTHWHSLPEKPHD